MPYNRDLENIFIVTTEHASLKGVISACIKEPTIATTILLI